MKIYWLFVVGWKSYIFKLGERPRSGQYGIGKKLVNSDLVATKGFWIAFGNLYHHSVRGTWKKIVTE